MRRSRTALIAALLALLPPALASAQQRPLVTEDPETVGAGRILIEGGIEYGRDVTFPASGLQGHLRRFPLIGVSVGLSSIAELQIDGGFQRLEMTARNMDAPLAHVVDVSGDDTTSVDDLVIATKIRLVSEDVDLPGIGIRFATRLPNASNESGLGLDTFDFHATLLAGKTMDRVRLVANLGIGILGDPVVANRQNDVIVYGFSFARAMTAAAEVVGEVYGRVSTRAGTPSPGTESRSVGRFGGRYTAGSWRVDAALIFGITAPDPSIGVTAGVTYVFDAFQVP